jgi:D-alanyl-D-alanine carboxypeptidase
MNAACKPAPWVRLPSVVIRKLAVLLTCTLVLGLGLAAAAEAKPQFSAIAVDARTGKILTAMDIDGLRHPASLTKVMTLYVLFQDLKAGRIKLSTNLLVSRRASYMAPSKLGLKAGATITVEDAIKALITRSANDVAATIGENLGGSEANFAARMTRTARAIGMSRSTFVNASGLPNPNQWTTARDMATLSLRIQRDFPQYYPYFRIGSFTYRGKVIRTHNKLLGRFQGTDGIKTGYIAASGFNLTTSAKRGDRRIVGVVMGARSGGWRDAYMMRMLDSYFDQCTNSATIAAVAGSSAGAINPLTALANAAPPAAPSKPTAVAGGAKAQDQSLEKLASAAAQDPSGAAFQSVDAGDAVDPLAGPKVLEAKMGDATADNISGDDGEDGAVADAAPAPPKKLPFQVKKKVDQADVGLEVASIEQSWNIQVGVFPKKDAAREKLQSLRSAGYDFLDGKPAFTVEVQKGKELQYRARFTGFTMQSARAACAKLTRQGERCQPFSPQS